MKTVLPLVLLDSQILSHLSFCSFVWALSWNWMISFFFSKFWHGVKNPYETVRSRFAKNVQNKTEIGFCDFSDKFGH